LRRIHRERSISPNASGKTALFMERFLRPVNLTSQNSASMFPPRHDSFLIQGRVTRTQGWLRSHPAHQFQPSSSNCTCDVEEQDNLRCIQSPAPMPSGTWKPGRPAVMAEGDTAAELRVGGLVNIAHAARSDVTRDLVLRCRF